MPVIEFKDVWEMYRIKFASPGKTAWENFWAVRGVSFALERGEITGIIGENGSGKSTVLKLITGMLKPDRGQVCVSGSVSGLLELGAGFQMELTGRENVFLQFELFGLNASQAQEKFQQVVDFAEIGKFMDAPVKCYSQGMFVRLAFSVAVHVDPEIFVIDDTLAVGDEFFQKKCIKKIFELKSSGKTIVFVLHDMNMLKRICGRTLLLKEGRLIKDGLTDDVVALYTQTVGTKKGIGISEKGEIQLVFNNGRLFVNWRGRLLTPGSGVYASFFLTDRWYNSFQADWEVSVSEGGQIEAAGKFHQLNCSQLLKAWISEDNAISLEIVMDSREPLQIQDGCLNAMLTDEYSQWCTEQKQGVFPEIGSKDNAWHVVMDDDNFSACTGVFSLGEQVPSFVIEQEKIHPASGFKLFNGDYLSSCRVLQYYRKWLQNYTEDMGSKFGYFSGRIIINTPDLNGYLHKLQNGSVVTDGNLRFKFTQGQGMFYYKDYPLTKGGNLTVQMSMAGNVYSSRTAHWTLAKRNGNQLVARGEWKGLPVVQEWCFEIGPEGTIFWKVGIDVFKEIDIEQSCMKFNFSPVFDAYRTDTGQGFFPAEFSDSYEDVLQKCISSGEIRLYSANPELCVAAGFGKALNNFFKLFNTDILSTARELRIYKIDPEANTRVSPGRHDLFMGWLRSCEREKYLPIQSKPVLKNGNLEFQLDNNTCRIYWMGREITKGLGLYTSLRSRGKWHDSVTCAVCESGIRAGEAAISFKWIHLPLRQEWRISLENEHSIKLAIAMIVEEGLEVDRLQTNIMLSEFYDKWSSAGNEGVLPDFTGDIDDDWQVIFSAGINKSGLYPILAPDSCAGKAFPEIGIAPDGMGEEWQVNLLNSDLYHRGRMLQCLKAGKEKLSAGEYPYFNGRILLESSR